MLQQKVNLLNRKILFFFLIFLIIAKLVSANSPVPDLKSKNKNFLSSHKTTEQIKIENYRKHEEEEDAKGLDDLEIANSLLDTLNEKQKLLKKKAAITAFIAIGFVIFSFIRKPN